MQFCFYPRHEHGCPNVSHCPHLGGAALGTLVSIANFSGDTIDRLLWMLDQPITWSGRIESITGLRERGFVRPQTLYRKS